jgi:hypothetical protein
MRPPVCPADPTAFDKRALEFLAEHPGVWALFCRFAFDLIRSGREHGGAKAIWERIRWEVATTAHYSDEEWALNNTHVASLVRIFAATWPEHESFFRTRKRPSERKAAA